MTDTLKQLEMTIQALDDVRQSEDVSCHTRGRVAAAQDGLMMALRVERDSDD